MNFQVGDKIKLTEYTEHIDYESHKGQTATIIRIDDDISIRWSDKTISIIFDNKLIKPNKITNWRNEFK